MRSTGPSLSALSPRAVDLRQQILRHSLQRTGNLSGLSEDFARLRQFVLFSISEPKTIEGAGILLVVLPLEQPRSSFKLGYR